MEDFPDPFTSLVIRFTECRVPELVCRSEATFEGEVRETLGDDSFGTPSVAGVDPNGFAKEFFYDGTSAMRVDVVECVV